MPGARQLLWISLAAAFALCVREFWFEPVPGFWALFALLWLVALVVLGVLIPRLEMFGDVLWCAPAGHRGVALTFDDGPDPRTTPQILASLKQAQVKATFFVVGQKAERHPDVIQAIHSAGHLLGIHSWSHERWYAFKTPGAVQADVARCQQLLFSLTGAVPTLFRPPIGQVSPRTAAGAQRAQVTLVGWSVRSRDGLRTTPEKLLRRVQGKLADGAIVLLHDAAERGGHEPASIAALPDLIFAIKEQGLRCVSLAEWAADASEAVS